MSLQNAGAGAEILKRGSCQGFLFGIRSYKFSFSEPKAMDQLSRG